MATLYVPPENVPANAYPKLPPRVRIEEAIETLIAILDAADPEADFEEIGAEDSFQPHDANGPGCIESDPDSAVDDRPCDDINMDLEPDHDAEIETWSHPDDHPAELFIGNRQ